MKYTPTDVSQATLKDYLLSHPRVLLGISGWLAAAILIIYIAIWVRLNQHERLFIEQASHAFNEVFEKTRINEAVLESFASLIRLVGEETDDRIRVFTSEMRTAYPHIYMLEVQSYVPDHKRHEFEQRQRNRGYNEYKIKSFDYDVRDWDELQGLPGYFPIHFVEPQGTNADAVLGLDMLSVPFLRDALVTATKSGQATATNPFTLIEGGRAYVLFKALRENPDFDPYGKIDHDSTVVSLLVKTDQLLRYASDALPGADIDLLSRDVSGEAVADFYRTGGHTGYTLILGQMEYSRELDDIGQPFTLVFKRHNGLTGWDLAYLLALASAITLLGIFYYHNAYRRYVSIAALNRTNAILASERQDLEQRVQERTRSLFEKDEANRLLTRKLVTQQEDNYAHIARELHDEFGQKLTAININCKLLSDKLAPDSAVTQLSQIQAITNELYNSMHSLMQRFRPEALDTFGLKVAIEHCISAVNPSDQGIKCSLHLQEEIDQLNNDLAITTYRAIQELVNNAIKHGSPDHIAVYAGINKQKLMIKVSDDGTGIDMHTFEEGYGQQGLRERAQALGGTINISSTPGQGCVVLVELPAKFKE